MTDREKIRAYIEKLHKESSVRAQKAIEDADSDAYLQSAQELATTSRLIRFIDSLPEEPVSESNKELAETYLAVFNKKFPILPSLSGKQLADYKNFLNKCQQIFGLKEWGIRSTQAKLFEKLSLLWAAWGAEHLQGVGRQDKKEQDIPVSEDLEDAADVYSKVFSDIAEPNIRKDAFIAGAKWKAEQFEKNRLKHCNSITNEQAELEQGFIDQHIDKHQRMPTFIDAIEYGMKLKKESC